MRRGRRASAAGCHDRLYDSGETISLIDGRPEPAPTPAAADRPPSGDAGVGGAVGTRRRHRGGRRGRRRRRRRRRQRQHLRRQLAAAADRHRQLRHVLQPVLRAERRRRPASAGACQYTCLADFVDADKDPANGCECEPTNNGVEICDGVDNDCNGIVDDGFDFMTDLNNCGGCNVPCYYPFAASSCDMGMCTQGACLPDFYDRDPATPGCETSCQKSNGGVEICDGLDNDCNGIVDDNVQAATITCKTKGVCAGTTPTCMGPAGYVCVYPADLPGARGHDQGLRRPRQRLRRPDRRAVRHRQGLLVGTGPVRRHGRLGLRQHPARQPAQCNGSPKTARRRGLQRQGQRLRRQGRRARQAVGQQRQAGHLHAGGRHVTMFAYEASRTTPGPTNGFDSTRRPCSVAGKQPWTNVTKEEAAAGVREDRHRLAPLHGDRVVRRLQRQREHHLPLRQHLRRHQVQRLRLQSPTGATAHRHGRGDRCASPTSPPRRRATSFTT